MHAGHIILSTIFTSLQTLYTNRETLYLCALIALPSVTRFILYTERGATEAWMDGLKKKKKNSLYFLFFLFFLEGFGVAISSGLSV